MVSVRTGYTQIYYYVAAQILLGAQKIVGSFSNRFCQSQDARAVSPLKVQAYFWQPSFVIGAPSRAALEVPLTLRSEVHGHTCCVRTSVPAAPSPLSVLD